MNASEAHMTPTREKDPPEVKPHRLVSFGTVITSVITAVLLGTGANALLIWKEQGVTQIRMQMERESAAERQVQLLSAVNALSAKLEAQNQMIAQLASDVRDHERRITRLEPRQ